MYYKNYEYVPLKICIDTGFKMLIPIGTVHLCRKNSQDIKVLVKKFYISKIWRKSGYEEMSVIAILQYCFSMEVQSQDTSDKPIEITKVTASAFTSNSYVITLLMNAGFRYNSTTTKDGDPKQRVILWIYKNEFQNFNETTQVTKMMKKKFYYNHVVDQYRNKAGISSKSS